MTKFSRWYKEIILPAGLLASVIIGAGIFALPFVFHQAGFLTGLFYLAAFTLVFTVVHRMYAEVIERTEGRHRFVGYAKIYFKRFGFITTIATTAIGFILTLVAYISLAGDFVLLIVPSVGDFSPYAFWLVASLAFVASLKRFANFEFAMTVAMAFIVLALLFSGVIYGETPTTHAFNSAEFFLPYGVVLFALSGRAAISAIYEYYEKRKIPKTKLVSAITWGTIVPAVVYVLFVIAVLFLSGGLVSEDALSGLAHISPVLLSLVGILGLFALWTSYFFLAIEVRDIFRYDFKLKRTLSTLLVVVAPLWLYNTGLTNFMGLIAIIGGVFLALDSIITIAMYSKIKGWGLLAKTLIILFAVGAIYEIINI